MKIFNSIVLGFYTLVFLLVGGLLIAYSLTFINPGDINTVLIYLQTEMNLRLIVGLAGVAIIIISLSILQVALGKLQQEKTLAYDNPDGQVTVALSAIEDLIKRIAKDFKEVKELKPSALVSKRGVQISCKTVLFQDAGIPEITQKIQTTIKTKIQNLLGIEEEISVRVHVVKILPKEKIAKEKEEKEEIPKVPFQYKSEV